MSIGMAPLNVDLNRVPISPSLSEMMMYSPWPWGLPIRRVPIRKIEFPSTPTTSSEVDNDQKRGRPRRSEISALKVKGTYSPSSIKCEYCNRVFPRQKSLLAHTRTHTGERPYICDFEGCTRAFCQSGQLKTHKRLHTGEKPFQCSHEGCASRFTHANRHCPAHPRAALKRRASEDSDEAMSPKTPKVYDENQPLDYSKASLNSYSEDQEFSSFYEPEEDNAYLTPIRKSKNRRPLKPRVCILEEPTCVPLTGELEKTPQGEKTSMTPSTPSPVMSTPIGRGTSTVTPFMPPPQNEAEDPLAVQCALTLVEFSHGGNSK